MIAKMVEFFRSLLKEPPPQLEVEIQRPVLLVEVVEAGYLLGRRIFVTDRPDGFELTSPTDLATFRELPPSFEFWRVPETWLRRLGNDPTPFEALRCPPGSDYLTTWWEVELEI